MHHAPVVHAKPIHHAPVKDFPPRPFAYEFGVQVRGLSFQNIAKTVKLRTVTRERISPRRRSRAVMVLSLASTGHH